MLLGILGQERKLLITPMFLSSSLIIGLVGSPKKKDSSGILKSYRLVNVISIHGKIADIRA